METDSEEETVVTEEVIVSLYKEIKEKIINKFERIDINEYISLIKHSENLEIIQKIMKKAAFKIHKLNYEEPILNKEEKELCNLLINYNKTYNQSDGDGDANMSGNNFGGSISQNTDKKTAGSKHNTKYKEKKPKTKSTQKSYINKIFEFLKF